MEPVSLTLTPDRHDGQWLRVRYLGNYIADCGSVTELKRWVALADLEQEGLTLAA